jgi:ADP-heptose:LPS heptosyltransferase
MGADTLSPDFAGSILVVRRDNIGDLVCTTPLIAALRAAYPRARIEALVNSYNAPVLERNPALDAVNVYTKLKHREPGTSLLAALAARWKLLRALRRKQFQVAVLARSGFDRHGLGFIRWLGIPKVFGFAPAQGTAAGLSCPVSPADNAALHEVEVVARLGQALGVADATGPLQAFPNPQQRDGFRARFGVQRPVVAVHVSAREASRRLPDDKWIAVIRGIAQQRPDTAFALFWSPGAADNPQHPGDDDKAQRILAALQDHPVFACPTGELDELIAGVAACDVFIGADGGALHVAVATGRPCVALFENSPFKRVHWAPWRVPAAVVAPQTFAIGDIEPEAIIRAYLALAPAA